MFYLFQLTLNQKGGGGGGGHKMQVWIDTEQELPGMTNRGEGGAGRGGYEGADRSLLLLSHQSLSGLLGESGTFAVALCRVFVVDGGGQRRGGDWGEKGKRERTREGKGGEGGDEFRWKSEGTERGTRVRNLSKKDT